MSLLLDALRRAEQEKRARQETSGAAPAAAASEEAAPEARVEPPARAPRLELEMVAEAPPAPAPAPAAAPAAPAAAPATPARAAAKAVFAAKQPAPEAPKSKRNLVIAAVAVVTLLVAGGGYYVWQEVNSLLPKSPMARAAPRPVVPAPPAGAPAKADDAAAEEKAGAEAPKARPPAAEPITATLLREASAASAPPPLRLTRSLESPKVLQEVASGYERLRRGDLAGARSAYLAAIAIEPANVDAELGLATVAARSGDRAGAGRHYRRALELDPRNATAAAGLAAIADPSQAGSLEGALRGSLERNPENAALQFTLGNLLASRGRWTEAQAAYFEAYRLEPANADIVHNLAVSLDNLGQSRLAAEHYRRALDVARSRPHQFDPAPVERRLADLSR